VTAVARNSKHQMLEAAIARLDELGLAELRAR